MRSRRASWIDRRCAALVALALILTGLSGAHPPPPAPAPGLAAFLEIGGALADLCLEAEDGEHAGDSCPMCQREEQAALVAPTALIAPPARAACAPRPVAAAPAGGRGPRAPPARGPPTSLA